MSSGRNMTGVCNCDGMARFQRTSDSSMVCITISEST